MPDVGVEFVELGGRERTVGLRRPVGQGVSVRGDPVGHRLVDHAEPACDAPQVAPIGIRAHRLGARLRRVATRLTAYPESA